VWTGRIQEKNRLTECFKQDEFRTMFSDYVKELQDPKNREEYNEYLRQCEAGGPGAAQIPEGMMLILPKVGFCLKTSSKKNGKVFVNITHSAKVKPASCVRVPGQGENWELPFCLDNPRPDVDSAGAPVTVYTIAFNTTCYEDFQREPRRRAFLIDVALENIDMALKEELDRKGFKEMKNLKFKGGTPTAMSIRKQDQNPAETFSASGIKGGNGVGAAQKDDTGPAKKRKGKKKKDKGAYGSKGFLDGKAKGKAQQGAAETAVKVAVEDEESEEEEEEEEQPVESGVCVPRHSVVHRGHFEMQDSMMGESKPQVHSCRPKELVVNIELPRVSNSREIDLDVSSERLVLRVDEKYDLLIDLPFPVDEENGRAKFDKGALQMVVTLPVVREVVPELPERSVPEEEPEEEEREPEPELPGAGAATSEAARAVGHHPYHHAGGVLREEGSGPAVARGGASAVTAAGADGSHSLLPAAAEMMAAGLAFHPSARWQGARAGYCFGTGDEETGYYRDSQQPAAEAPRPAAGTEEGPPSAAVAAASAPAPAAVAAAVAVAPAGVAGFSSSILLELD
jgi:dynein assembly factor 2